MQLVRVDRDPYTMRGPVVRFDARVPDTLVPHGWGVPTHFDPIPPAAAFVQRVPGQWRQVYILEPMLDANPGAAMLCVERVRRALLNGAP